VFLSFRGLHAIYSARFVRNSLEKKPSMGYNIYLTKSKRIIMAREQNTGDRSQDRGDRKQKTEGRGQNREIRQTG